MTRPLKDGRPMLERARELTNLGGGYEAHDRSGEVAEALAAAMLVVESAFRWYTDPGRFEQELRRAVQTISRVQ